MARSIMWRARSDFAAETGAESDLARPLYHPGLPCVSSGTIVENAMTSLSRITDGLRPFLAENAGNSKTLKFELEGGGFLRVSGAEASNEDGPADCIILVSLADLELIASGDLDPMEAFQQGRLRIDGDMAVAVTLQPILSRAW